MEDTKSLLIMVLQKVFENRPKIIEDTFQVIYNYNNGKKEKLEYEKTLKTICELMNEELPSQILVYLLTMVDMPTGDGCQLPIMEKMQRTHNCLPESVRPHLLEYLRRKKPAVPKKAEVSSVNTEGAKESPGPTAGLELSDTRSLVHSEEEPFAKPVKRTRLRKKWLKNVNDVTEEWLRSPKTLLYICAEIVVQHESELKQRYRRVQQRAWRLINTETLEGAQLQQCYTLLHDLNKKAKWLRHIESDSITTDMLLEEYQHSEALLTEHQHQQLLLKDPFRIPQVAQAYLDCLLQSFT